MTSYTEFYVDYLVKNGYQGSEENLTKAPKQLKKELDETTSRLNLSLGINPLMWSSSTKYIESSYVSYNNKIWRSNIGTFIDPNINAEPGVSANWVEITDSFIVNSAQTINGYSGTTTELNYLVSLYNTGVTPVEFDYLDGVTSNIQTQLNSKSDTNHTHNYLSNSGGTISGDLTVTNNLTINGPDVVLTGNGRIQGIDRIIDGTDAISLNYLNSTTIGHDQTWLNVTGSRAMGVTYTNTTGKPIMVSIMVTRNAVSTTGCNCEIDGVSVTVCYNTNSGGGNVSVGQIIIPNGKSYRMVNNAESAALSQWYELR